MNLNPATCINNNLYNSAFRIRFILLFILILRSTIFSQNAFDLTQLKDESFRFIQKPAEWESNDWLKVGLLSAGTILLMQADQSIRENVLKDQRYYKSFPIEAGRFWGEGIPTLVLAGAFGLHGLASSNKTTKKIGFEIVQSAIYAGAVTSIIKIVAGRARPFTDKGEATFKPLSLFDDDFHSLPSGHVTLAFSLSTVLAKNTNSDLLKIIAYLPALLTAVSRVYQDNHWASDVFLGAAIGYYVGDWVTNQHDEEKSGFQTTSLFPLSVRIAIF